MTIENMPLTDQEFRTLQAFIESVIGVKLTDTKRALVMSRLSKRVRELNIKSYQEYIELVNNDPDELQVLFNKITTNVTQFFRESHHFNYLQNVFLPKFVADPAHSQKKSLRVWSSACSTGEEPYTIAMCLLEFFKQHPGWKIQILASDINTDALNKAKSGIYNKQEITGIPYNFLKTYFKMGVNENEGKFKAKDSLQKIISFKQINLITDTYPITEPLHIIFCRNVFIYFDKQTQKGIINRFANNLHDDGVLMLGHSESINSLNSDNKWNLVGQTIYTKGLT
ncbi:CheR family methyltransferase [Desulfuribacillus alkaliarsenatis]|uniref:protein-glutamate O-methyltransferase n=1 Tax=Desulfuribacillus alkaliarsenatis TaxID=766136 RepID=A0A1E5FZ24_9FIRM|nr:protein-glutamate O-methyltransferase CheR [Desulfuribacillus alkaliarsenatis]OEF95821.1 hypothetical protein BHF68_10505 [Desulfuribacillus alkaliarsenatis]